MMKLKNDMLTYGVNIVCAQYEGEKRGLAVAWATQIDTNYILICVGSQSVTRELILNSRAFGLSILVKGQENIAKLFGGNSSRKVNKFEKIGYHTAITGSPLLDDCAAAFDCKVENVHDHGSEKLIIGRIVEAEFIQKEYEPLIYREKDY
jgi:flavin reductase (DIM6/NTAB) family NADH-FMN oxidoreductase RutF